MAHGRRIPPEERLRILALADRHAIPQIAKMVGRSVATLEKLIARERKKKEEQMPCRTPNRWRCGGPVNADGLCVYHAAVAARSVKAKRDG